MKKCNACNYMNKGDNVFCSECGASLEDQQSSRSVSKGANDLNKKRPAKKRHLF